MFFVENKEKVLQITVYRDRQTDRQGGREGGREGEGERGRERRYITICDKQMTNKRKKRKRKTQKKGRRYITPRERWY